MRIHTFPKCSWLSLHNVTCIYVFRANIWYWVTNWCALPRRGLFLQLLVFLSCLHSLGRVEASGSFLLGMPMGVIIGMSTGVSSYL